AEENPMTNNSSSANPKAYFEGLSRAYLGTNTGNDRQTGLPRNNGADWVRENASSLQGLMERLYESDNLLNESLRNRVQSDGEQLSKLQEPSNPKLASNVNSTAPSTAGMAMLKSTGARGTAAKAI